MMLQRTVLEAFLAFMLIVILPQILQNRTTQQPSAAYDPISCNSMLYAAAAYQLPVQYQFLDRSSWEAPAGPLQAAAGEALSCRRTILYVASASSIQSISDQAHLGRRAVAGQDHRSPV